MCKNNIYVCLYVCVLNVVCLDQNTRFIFIWLENYKPESNNLFILNAYFIYNYIFYI